LALEGARGFGDNGFRGRAFAGDEAMGILDAREIPGFLHWLRKRFAHRRYVHPDPLEFLYDYSDPLDREVVGLVASSLAYGRVGMILRNVGRVLAALGRPREALASFSPEGFRRRLGPFRHRFATGEEVCRLLLGVSLVVERHGSLNACFLRHVGAEDETTLAALGGFVGELREAADGLDSHLLPHPERRSACKRLHLFLRWMVRRDEVDPGDWEGVAPSMLIVPLDVHLHRLCRALGLTARAAADARTALAVTEAFRRFAPGDPVRYDFALTRLGIRGDATLEGAIAEWRETRVVSDN